MKRWNGLLEGHLKIFGNNLSFLLWNMDSTWFGHHLFYLQNDCSQSEWKCVSQKDTCP